MRGLKGKIGATLSPASVGNTMELDRTVRTATISRMKPRGGCTCHLEALLQLQPVGSDPPLLVAGHHPHDEPRLPPELHQPVHPSVKGSTRLPTPRTKGIGLAR